MDGVTDEVAHRQPGGTAHPIGSRYAHLVVSEVMMINGLLKGGAPLFATSWAGKTVREDPQAAFATTLEWAQTVKVDLEAMNKYAELFMMPRMNTWRRWRKRTLIERSI